MTMNWEVKKLGEVCDFEGGSQPPKTFFSDVETEDSIRLIQIRDYKSDNYIVYIPRDKAKRFCDENDIMIGRYGPPVFQILKGLKGAYNVALMKAIPNEEIISRDYLFLFLKYSKIQDYIINLSQRAAGQTGVNKEALKAYPILLPPLTEQKRIVAFLDEFFATIATVQENAERNLQNAREVYKTCLRSVFSNPNDGWKKMKMKDVCTFINGRAYKKEELLSKGKYPVLRVGNFFTNNNWYYSDLELPEDKYCDEGDLLYAWSASFGPRIWRGDKVIYHYHIWKIIQDDAKILKEFLYLTLLWDTDRLKEQGNGTTMVHITKGNIENTVIHVPSLPEQQRIVVKLDELSVETQRLEAIYQQKLLDLDELKKAIIKKAFDGDLEVIYERS